MSQKDQQPEIEIKNEPEIELPNHPEIDTHQDHYEIEQPGHPEIELPDHKEVVEAPEIPVEDDTIPSEEMRYPNADQLYE